MIAIIMGKYTGVGIVGIGAGASKYQYFPRITVLRYSVIHVYMRYDQGW